MRRLAPWGSKALTRLPSVVWSPLSVIANLVPFAKILNDDYFSNLSDRGATYCLLISSALRVCHHRPVVMVAFIPGMDRRVRGNLIDGEPLSVWALDPPGIIGRLMMELPL